MAQVNRSVKPDDAEETLPAETIVSASEVQDRLGDILDRALGGERFRITRHGRERAVLLSKTEYERLLELAGITPAAA
jgi:prevent-host-death family protein